MAATTTMKRACACSCFSCYNKHKRSTASIVPKPAISPFRGPAPSFPPPSCLQPNNIIASTATTATTTTNMTDQERKPNVAVQQRQQQKDDCFYENPMPDSVRRNNNLNKSKTRAAPAVVKRSTLHLRHAPPQHPNPQRRRYRSASEVNTFTFFVRALLKYLKQEDLPTYQRAVASIQETTQQFQYPANDTNDDTTPSLTAQIRANLQVLVRDEHWNHVGGYLREYLREMATLQHQREQQQLQREKQQAPRVHYVDGSNKG